MTKEDFIAAAREQGDERNELDILLDYKDDSPRVFVIPSPNMPRFEERLAKLIKRAQKLGVALPTYTTLKEEAKTIQVVVGVEEDPLTGRTKQIVEDRVIILHHITLQFSEVIVVGYEFVATLEHTEDGNILHCKPGFEGTLPKQYRDCAAWCDHCKTVRRRRDTFVLRHVDTNAFLQVGRNCLADFLGRNADRYASAAELYFEVGELAEASESEGGSGWGSSGPRYDMLDSFLSHVSETIIRHGWKSRTSAREYGGAATCDIAYRHLHPSREDIRDNLLEWHTPSDAATETAKAAIAWCESIADSETDNSDYLHNIRLIARRAVVSSKQYGYAASIVSCYQRHIGELVRKERLSKQAEESRHVGQIGERSNFCLTVDHIVHLESQYGTTLLHLMYDRCGNRYTWMSSSRTLEKGKEYLLKGTVKAHDEYKGVKQTKLSRCDVLEMHTYICMIGACKYEIPAESEKAARKQLCETLGIKRLPQGTTLIEEERK